MTVSSEKRLLCFEGLVSTGPPEVLIGVCEETIRNWNWSGRLASPWNQLSGYRSDRQQDLEAGYKQVIADREVA